MARIVSDIRFWLALVLLIRSIGITDPPIEATHSWRQAFTNMVARNMAEGDIDLLHPRTDLAGERVNIVASEFPAFNAIIATLYRVFGPAHWYGRVIALVVSTLGAWALYRIVLSRYGERIAFLSTFVLIWSSWFVYGRKSMPDTFSIALILIALWAVDNAVRERRAVWFIIAVPLAALGGLCKIPAVVLMIPWGLLLFHSELPMRWRSGASVAFGLAMAPVLLWYFWWQPHLLETYGNPLYFPRSIADGAVGLWSFKAKLFERFRFSALLSHLAFAASLFGIWRLWKMKDKVALISISCIAFLFGYFMLKAGDVFPLHAYYMLPIVPLMALLAGIGMEKIPKGAWTFCALFLVVIEAGGIRWNDLVSTDKEYMLGATTLADRFTNKEDLVATNADMDPRMMYFLDRHGWNLSNAQLASPEQMDSLRVLGLKAVFIDRHAPSVPVAWPLQYEDDNIQVFLAP